LSRPYQRRRKKNMDLILVNRLEDGRLVVDGDSEYKFPETVNRFEVVCEVRPIDMEEAV
jgi:hypothetical protein